MLYIYTPNLSSASYSLQHKALKCSSYRYRQIKDEWLIVSPDTKGWCVLSNNEYAVYQKLATQPFIMISESLKDQEERDFIASLVECGLVEPFIDGFNADTEIQSSPNPFLLTLILSTHCNLACGYCYLNLSGSVKRSYLNLNTAQEAIRNVFDMPHKKIMIDFGEISLSLSLFQKLVLFTETLQRERPDKSVTLAIQTNGTTLKPSLLDYLEHHNVLLGISMDGPRKFHDQIRVSPSGWGSHIRAELGLQEIIKRSMPHIVLCTVSSVNVEHAEELTDYFLQLGVSHFAFKPVIKRGTALENWQLVGVTVSEYKEFLSGVVNYAIEHQSWNALDVHLTKALFRLLRDPRGWTDRCPSNQCGAGTDMLVVNPNGDYYPCPRLTSLGRNSVFLGSNFADAVRAGYRLGLVSSLRQCTECIWSTYCEGHCRLSDQVDETSGPTDDSNCSIQQHIYELFLERVIPATNHINGSGNIGPGKFKLIQRSFFDASAR